MRKGLAMWVMSKLVLVIFLFSLVLVLTLFMGIYREKLISDTANSHVLLWAESANGALLYRSSIDTVDMPTRIELEGAEMEYTLMFSKVGDERVVIFFAWHRHESESEMREQGFASAAAVNMPLQISDEDGNGGVMFFEGSGELDAFRRVAELDRSGNMLVKPTSRIGRDKTLVFNRNEEYFCIGTIKEGMDLERSLDIFEECCRNPDESGYDLEGLCDY